MARTKNTKQLAVEVSDALFDEFKRFCADRGETVRRHLELALRRHMDNPPPPPEPAEVPPLPPVTAPAPAAGASGPAAPVAGNKPVAKKGKK